jgi:hypothetical protein
LTATFKAAFLLIHSTLQIINDGAQYLTEPNAHARDTDQVVLSPES